MPKNILNRFKYLLGEYCAVNQFVELSNRVFFKNYNKLLEVPESFRRIAFENELTLTGYDIFQTKHRVALNYIIGTHLCFSVFLDDLNDELNKYGVKKTQRYKTDEESKLSFLVDMILSPDMITENKSLIDLCEYYRLVRNCAAHDIIATRELLTKFRSLDKYTFETTAKFSRLDAPNEYSQIQFDDFVMFSRTVQQLARVLYKALEYNYDLIVASIEKHVDFNTRTNRENVKRHIINYILTYFKDDGSLLEKSDYLCDIVMARWSNG